MMTNPRVQKLFRTLDSQLSPEILDILGAQELIYVFAFDNERDDAGELTIYRAATSGAAGAEKIEVEKQWFYENRLWFRKCPQGGQGLKYEAFVEYLTDYRDDVIVDLGQPIVRIPIPNLHGRPVPNTQALLAKYRLQPELQL